MAKRIAAEKAAAPGLPTAAQLKPLLDEFNAVGSRKAQLGAQQAAIVKRAESELGISRKIFKAMGSLLNKDEGTQAAETAQYVHCVEVLGFGDQPDMFEGAPPAVKAGSVGAATVKPAKPVAKRKPRGKAAAANDGEDQDPGIAPFTPGAFN